MANTVTKFQYEASKKKVMKIQQGLQVLKDMTDGQTWYTCKAYLFLPHTENT